MYELLTVLNFTAVQDEMKNTQEIEAEDEKSEFLKALKDMMIAFLVLILCFIFIII